MDTQLPTRKPWLSLGLLWLAYGGLGWYLSAHDILWIVSASIVAIMLTVVSKSSPLLRQSLWFGSQDLFIAIALSLTVSITIALAAIWTSEVTLIAIPLLTTFLAQIDSGFTGCQQRSRLLWLIVVAGSGLFLGELFDLTILPRVRL